MAANKKTDQTPAPEENEVLDLGPEGETVAEAPVEGGEANAVPENYVGVDVSGWSEEERATLAELPQDVVKRLLDAQHGKLTSLADSKFNKAAQMMREAEAKAQAAQFGEAIAQNPALLQGLFGNQQQQAPEVPTVPLGEIEDMTTSSGEQQVARRILELGGLTNLDNKLQQMEDRLMERFQSTPVVKNMQLKSAAEEAFSRLEESGMSVDRQAVSRAYVNTARQAGQDPFEVSPAELRNRLYFVAHAMNNGSAKTAPSRPKATPATTPPGTSSAPVKGQTPWEREGRAPTNDEIFEHAGGTSGEGMEELLDQARNAHRNLMG